MERVRKLIGAVAALALGATILAACSSGSAVGASSDANANANANANGSGAASAAASKGAPITVGIECTCSGSFGADISDAADTYKAWADSVNASGGLNGHHVKIVSEDDAGTPGKSTTQVKTLLSDHVDAILDLSIVDAVWAKTVQSSGIPVVGGDESETTYYQYSDFYPEGQTNNSVVYAVAETAKQAGAKSMGYFYCAEAASCAQGLPLFKADGQKVGVPVTYSTSISATAPNYTAQCVAAEQQHVGGVFIGDSGSVIANVGKDCNAQGYDPVYLTEGEGFTLSEAAAPGLDKKNWAEYENIPFFDNIPAIKKMNATVDKYYPGIRKNKTVWSQIAVEGWASGLLLQTAVKHSGMNAHSKPSTTAIIKGLDSLKHDTLDGMAPPLTFKAGQVHPVNCWFTGHVENGKPQVANHGKVTCEKGAAA